MPAGTRPPAPPPLPPAECKAVAVKHYEAGPPLGNELVEPGETVATTKEEEWVTKKTRELTTRRQIATRVQRQVVLEDGRVLQDSGPLVSTTTSEDTETHEHEHTEHRKLDDPPGEDVDAVDGAQMQIEGIPDVVKALANGDLLTTQDGSSSKWVAVANPDGKVREIKERRVLTHEEIDERKETEERQHFGDITDEAYLKAVSTGREDIRQALRTCTDEDLSKALVSSGPKLVHESSKTKKTIDTEEKEESRALHPSGDGRILTESKVTTEHEEINDEDLPENEGKSLSSGSLERKKESGERWRRTKDQEYVDHMAGGARLAREMRYNADTEEGEKYGDPGMEDPQDWDSLSARVRRQRRQGQQKTLMQRQRDAETLQDRKDALTKKPLDFDLEEETRKKETSKWLEHHFGSDSRSSRDSIGDEIADEGPSTSYFNVTIKSQNQQASHVKPTYVPDPPRAKSPLRQKIIHPVNNTPPRIFVPSPEPESVPSRTKGFFQGVSEWSQRKTDETRLRSDMSPRPADSPPSTDHTRVLRSPALQRDDSAYVSSSTVNTPYRRSSPERASPFQSLDRRDSPDRAYSPMHRQQYKQVAQPQYKAPIDDDNIRYDRGPAPPERKRAIERKQRSSNDSNRYDSGYRSHSRNEASYREEMAEEPPPDYSPPRGVRGKSRSPTRSPSPPHPARSSRKPSQRTRFEEPQAKKSVGAAIGQSIRKLVGKIRSASQERRGRQKGKRASRSPSPRNLSSTYQQYGSVDSDPPAARGRRGSGGGVVNGGGNGGPRVNRAPDMERRTNGEPIQRYYLGEDPFGGSIYGRENKYDGARPQRSRKTPVNGHNGTNGDEHRTTFTTTLGRFSKSTSRLANNGNSSDEYMRNSQTLPRKLHDEQIQKKTAQKQYSAPQPPKQWENDRLVNNKRSSSTINVSIVNVTPPSSALGVSKPLTNGTRLQGPIKPARTYKALNRSKSFNVHAMEPVNDIPKSGYFGNSNRLSSSSMYKSNPHLSRLDETPEQLKSPGIVSIISRSQRDLSSVVEREDEDRKENVYNSRFAKKSSYTNGYNSPTENGVNDKKKIFLKSLQERSPELYQTLHGDDEIDGVNGRGKSPTPLYNSTPIKNGYVKQTIYNDDIQYKSDPYRRDTSSPYRPINGVDKFKSSEGYASNPGYSVVRRGSANSDNFSETYRTHSRSDDPRRPSVTNTVQTVSKKTIPSRDGRTKETIESTETTTVTKSRYVGDPMSNLKYIENGGRLNGLDHRRGSGQSVNERRGSNGVMIDSRDYRK